MNETAALLTLLLFNSEVARDLAQMDKAPRVFVGSQLSENAAALSWTTCVPESGVLVVQLAARAVGLDDRTIKHVAAHEACHVILHGKTLCGAAFREMVPELRDHLKRHMEVEAERCATDMQARAK